MLYTFNKELLFLNSKSGVIQFFDYYHRLLQKGNQNHFHGENIFEFHYVVSGHAKLTIGYNKTYEIDEDDMFIVGPFVNHCQIAEDDTFTEKMTFCLKVPNICLANEFNKLRDLKFRLFKNVKNAKGVFVNLENALSKGIDLEKNVSKIILSLFEALEPLKKDKYDKSQILDMINENFKITPDDAASRMNVSRRTLERTCQAMFDTTFINLRNECRLNHATRLLEFTDLPIGDVCVECGFSDVNYFGNEFRKKYGCSPKKYRKDFYKI